MLTKEQMELIGNALQNLAEHVYEVAASKGWHDEPVPVPVTCSNLHGEVSELWEAYRANRLNEPCDKAEKMVALGLPPLTCIEEETADIIIRALDLVKEYKVDIKKALCVKDAFNMSRPTKHGGKIA